MACISPFFSLVRGNWMPFPCGRCPPCKRRRIDGWVFRMLQESKRYADPGRFITLTYAPHSVPISPHGFMTLTKGYEDVPCDPSRFDSKRLCCWPRKYSYQKDLCCFTKYMKRLRKLCPGATLKYFACGEYGEDYRRPHWHAIVFGVPDDELFYKAWHVDGKPIGRVDVGQVTGKSIAYTVGYINKSDWQAMHGRDDRIPEFCLMSKGLGSNYVTPAIVSYHKADLSRNYLTKDGGDKIAMPRYYRDRIYDEDERNFQQGLSEIASGESNSKKFDYYSEKYGFIEGYSYDKYLEAERLGCVTQFYSQLKSRSYDGS